MSLIWIPVGSLDTQDDETALPQKGFHPWLVPADTDGEHEELPDYEDDFLLLEWPNIIFDESTMQEIGNNKDNPPQIIEAAKALLKVSGGIKAIMISLCLLARKTNPLLSSSYRVIKKISSGL